MKINEIQNNSYVINNSYILPIEDLRRQWDGHCIKTGSLRRGEMALRLEELRFNNRLSKKEFARRCSVKESTMATYISGKVSPSIDKIEQIADSFNVNPAWLAGWENKEVTKIVYQETKKEQGQVIKWTKRGVPIE